MPQYEPNPPDPDDAPPLVFRSYRRHRKQSKWGTWALFFPPIAALWSVFWLLVMNQKRDNPAAAASNWEAWVMAAGNMALLGAGIALATRGMMDTYNKHGRAALALAINLVLLLAVLFWVVLGLLASKVA